MKLRALVLFLASLLLEPALAWAGEGPRFASFTLENDFFAGQDRHYTNGLQLAFVTPIDAMPASLRALPPVRWSDATDVVFAFGQRLYTPSDTQVRVPDAKDRPYAGWLYGLLDVQSRNNGFVVDHVTLTLGVVGPSALGRQTQDLFHRATQSRKSAGWGSQLHDEPAITVAFERAWPALVHGPFFGWKQDLSPIAGATVGNVLAYVDAGAIWRFGSVLPDDLPATHVSLGPSRDGYRGTRQAGWYVWAGGEARAVAHNIFLDGNTGRGGPSVKRKVGGYDLELGVALVWPTMRVSFMLVERGREFEGQRAPDRFGQLAISVPY
jgi:hypothetical protein